MLFLAALILSNLCYSYGEAHVTNGTAPLRPVYRSQTLVYISIPTIPSQTLCECCGDVCYMNALKADAICKAFKQRFIQFTDPSPYFIMCEIDPEPCQSTFYPDKYTMRITYDTFYLKTSQFFSGNDTAGAAVLETFNRNEGHPHRWLNQKPSLEKVMPGYAGMPLEFEGVLNVNADDFEKFEYCETDECKNYISDFCEQMIEQMAIQCCNLMRASIGCHVRHVYKVNDQIKIYWALLFNFEKLVEYGKVSSLKELEGLIQMGAENVTHPMLTSYRMLTYIPLDYCIVEASASTNRKYHEHMSNPFTTKYRTTARQQFEPLRKQLELGDKLCPNCLHRISNVRITNKGGFEQVHLYLWLSRTCAKKHNLNTCEQVTSNVAQQWAAGAQAWPNFWTPKYDFKLAWAGSNFK